MKTEKARMFPQFSKLVSQIIEIGNNSLPENPAFVEFATALSKLSVDKLSMVLPKDRALVVSINEKKYAIRALCMAPLFIDNPAVLELFIKQGFNFHTFSIDGCSLLNCALMGGAKKCAMKLIELGANCGQQDEAGFSPIMHAVIRHHHAIVRAMLRNKDMLLREHLISNLAVMVIAQQGEIELLEFVFNDLVEKGFSMTNKNFPSVFHSLIFQEFYRCDPSGFNNSAIMIMPKNQVDKSSNIMSLSSKHFEVMTFLMNKGILSPFVNEGTKVSEYFEMGGLNVFKSFLKVKIKFMDLFLKLGTGFDPSLVSGDGYLKRSPMYKVPDDAQFCVLGTRPDTTAVRCYTIKDFDEALKSDVKFEYESLWRACGESTLSEELKDQIRRLLKTRYPQLESLKTQIISEELPIAEFQWPPLEGAKSWEMNSSTRMEKLLSDAQCDSDNLTSQLDAVSETNPIYRDTCLNYYSSLCQMGDYLVNSNKNFLKKYKEQYLTAVQSFSDRLSDLVSDQSLLNALKAILSHLRKLGLLDAKVGTEIRRYLIMKRVVFAHHQFSQERFIEAEHIASQAHQDPIYLKLTASEQFSICELLLRCALKLRREDIIAWAMNECFENMEKSGYMYGDFLELFEGVVQFWLQEQELYKCDKYLVRVQKCISSLKATQHVSVHELQQRMSFAPIEDVVQMKSDAAEGVKLIEEQCDRLKIALIQCRVNNFHAIVKSICDAERKDILDNPKKPFKIVFPTLNQSVTNSLLIQLEHHGITYKRQGDSLEIELREFELLSASERENLLSKVYACTLAPLATNSKDEAVINDNIVRGIQNLHLRQKPKKKGGKAEKQTETTVTESQVVTTRSSADERAEIEKQIKIPDGYSKPIKIYSASHSKEQDNSFFIIIKNDLIPQYKSTLTNRGGDTPNNPNEPWTTQLLPKRSLGENGAKFLTVKDPKTKEATLAVKVKSVGAGDVRAWSQAGYKNYVVANKNVTVFHVDAQASHNDIKKLQIA